MYIFLNLIVVGIGGFIGAISRYLMSSWVQSFSQKHIFPYGTLAVNLLGCLIIGILLGLSENINFLGPRGKLLLITGFLGALTTFSTFGYETFELIKDSEFVIAFVNIGSQVVIGLFAVWAGNIISKLII